MKNLTDKVKEAYNAGKNYTMPFLAGTIIGGYMLYGNLACEKAYGQQRDFTYTINEFGKSRIATAGASNVNTVYSCDMDGDGDQDIIAGGHNGFHIFENKIPQKSKK